MRLTPQECNEEDLDRALQSANVPTLLMVLVHLTGDQRWLADPYRPSAGRGLDDHDSGGLPEVVQEEIRDAASEAVMAWHRGSLQVPREPLHDDLARMMAWSLGEPIGLEYGPLLAAELGVGAAPPAPSDGGAPRRLRVLVIGAGPSGVAMAIALGNAGIDYTVIEKNPAAGGTWLENRYPGCGCDTPSHLYSFSFAPNAAGWSRYYAGRDELHDYFDECAVLGGVLEHVLFDREVVSATYDESSSAWIVTVRGGDGEEILTFEAIVSAVGQLNRPKVPALPGLETFAGRVVHTARWSDDIDIRQKRVTVVGTGASAMQLVPAIAGEASKVTVMQRSPQWAMPNPNYKRMVSEETRFLMARVPFYAEWYRIRLMWLIGDRVHASLQADPAWDSDQSINVTNDSVRRFLTKYIESEVGVGNQELLAKAVPGYPPFGKRMLMDNGWFRTMAREDVDLVTDGLREVRPEGVLTATGDLIPTDVLVLATGFESLRFLYPMEFTGRSGRTLRETWGTTDASAFLGIAVPDFPNLFLMYGPNTNLHGGSILFVSECQAHYISQLLAAMEARGVAAVDCRVDTHDEYNERLEAALSTTVWAHRSVRSYYRNERGRVVTNTPWRIIDYWLMTRTPDLDHYEVIPRPAALPRF